MRAVGVIIAALEAAVTGASVGVHPDAPPPAHTGGFGEPSCHQCHFDNALNDTSGALRVTTMATRYEPAQLHRVEIRLTHTDMGWAGFEVSARYQSGPSAGRQAGVWSVIDGRVAITVGGEWEVAYAHQSDEGIVPTGGTATVWTIEWVAPEGALGPVVFHVAANAANGDNSALGDFIYVDSLVLAPHHP